MSPYEILGIRPTADLDEAEAAYRALLRECHPDLHAHTGGEAVAWAEQRTRELNGAIHSIRTEGRVFVGTNGDSFGRSHGFDTSADTDWFGDPNRPRFTINCVMCGVEIHERSAYRVHLLLDHAFAERVRKRRRAARAPRLTMIPAPMFWALMLLLVYWAAVFQIFGDSHTAIVGWWLGILGFLIFLPFAYKAERYRRRF